MFRAIQDERSDVFIETIFTVVLLMLYGLQCKIQMNCKLRLLVKRSERGGASNHVYII